MRKRHITCDNHLSEHNKHNKCKTDRKDIRKQRIQQWWKNNGDKVKLGAGALAAVLFLISVQNDEAPSMSFDSEIDEFGSSSMKCANCGNTDISTLFDEGDTFYCSKCYHRTRISTREDDSVLCPYCHKMRDRKALYCRYCNSTWN